VLSRTTYFFTATSLADMIRSRRIVAAEGNHVILSNSLTPATR
jgi:hypothetical protein